jgi:rhodanese-related sulfurtransferase
VQLVVSSIRVLVVGLALGIAGVVLRGTPALEAPEGLCTGEGDDAASDAPHFTWITQTEASELVRSHDVIFTDARPREIFEQGHVAGAVSLPSGEPRSADELAMLRGARVVVVYCDTGEGCNASTELASELVREHVPSVRVLEGGMPAWLENGHPAEAGTCRLCP